MANEDRGAVGTYELNLFFTGGWLFALASIRASVYGVRSRGETHRNQH